MLCNVAYDLVFKFQVAAFSFFRCIVYAVSAKEKKGFPGNYYPDIYCFAPGLPYILARGSKKGEVCSYEASQVFANKEHTDKLSIAERGCPICPGDILYVRETWCDDRQFTHDDTPGQYFYKAGSSNERFKWRPSIHMPKEATRIWLKVTDVRVERLQDITIDGIRNLIVEVEAEFYDYESSEETLI